MSAGPPCPTARRPRVNGTDRAFTARSRPSPARAPHRLLPARRRHAPSAPPLPRPRRHGASFCVGRPPNALTPGSAVPRPCASPPHRWRTSGQWRLPDPTRAQRGNVSPYGVVKWFDPDRGTGRISTRGAGPDVAVEACAIHGKDRRLHQGEEVLFNITLDSAGLRADDIHRTVRAEAHPSKPSHAVTLHSGVLLIWSTQSCLPSW
ncbi:cold shock domain-containing protein [Streptomyces sp. NPDC051000]|uniref:cold-shock protein n=1 Tax=Streptomyces sp. NPDC051000 TaxID=3155520 RepID=UPI0033F23340